MKPQIAKLTRPRLAGVVDRSRLFDHLDRAGERKIVWISAPAGSGKTTLVASWLDSRKLPCLWYQADEGDGDIATFFSYLGKAAKHAAPRYRTPLPLFTPEYSLGIPTFTKHYFEALFRRLKPPFCFVIDNYQDVPAGSLFHEVVRDGLSVIPGGISVAIVSRSDPPPPFARLQAGSRVELMPREEIWFTFEEAGALVESRRGKTRPSEAALNALFQKTEGWAAGLVLMSDAMRKDGDLLAVSGAWSGSVFDYFAEELLGRAEPSLRNFLLRTAFFPGMTAKNARELTENEHADQFLSNLSRSNFFIQRYTTPEFVYQYHPLFREFLLGQAKDVFGPDETDRIKKKAAVLLLGSGQTESAAELLAETGDWDEYVRLVLAHARVLAGQGRLMTLTEWIERVPKGFLEAEPWLLFWLGACKKASNPPQGRALLEKSFELFKAKGDSPGLLLTWAEIIDTFLYEWNDFSPLDRWILWLDGRMKTDPSFPSPEVEARVASCMVNALVFRRPDHPEMKQWLDRALNFIENIADVGSRMLAYVHLINYYLWMGDNATGLWMLEKIGNIARVPAATPFMTIVSNWAEAVTHGVAQADFETSLRQIAEGIETAEKTGIHIWDNFLFGFGAYSALCKGDMEVADEYLKKMGTMFAGQIQNTSLQNLMSALSFNLLGDLVHAKASGEKTLAVVTESGMFFNIAQFNIVVANIYHKSGEYRKAADHIALAHEMVRRSQSMILEYMCLLTEAYFILRQGETAAGMKVLQQAIVLGRSQGYMGFIFWWDPHMMAELCARALDAGIEVEYVRTLIRKRNLVPDPSFVVPESWPWPFKIYTLGRFDLIIDGKPVIFSGKVQKKPLEMLKALIASGGTNVPEVLLTDALWPDAEGDGAKRSFDTTLHRLRKLLGNEAAIVVHDGQLSLDRRRMWVDAWMFERLLSDAEHAGKSGADMNGQESSAVILMERAQDLYQGHFLPGESKQAWSMSRRERLHMMFLRSISNLSNHWQLRGNYERAVQVIRKGLEVDDLAEELYQKLMVYYHQMGQETDTVKTYYRCRTVLSKAFGIEPSAKTKELFSSIYRNG